MPTTRPHRSAMLIGAAVGLALFLALALLPTMLYAGYAGVMLGTVIFGAPVHSTLPVRVLIVAGMVVGVTAVAALFAIGGAAAGAAVSVLVSHGSQPAAAPRAAGAAATKQPPRH